MAGGVSPYEWIMPPVALSHVGYNAAAQQVSPRAKIDTAGSKNDKKKTLGDAQQQQDQDARVAEERRASQYLADNPPPQTPEQERAARRRGDAAGAGRYGGKRASQYLASDETALGVA